MAIVSDAFCIAYHSHLTVYDHYYGEKGMSKSKAETLCGLIDDLDIRGKAEVIKIITEKMLVENMYKGLDDRTSQPRIKLTNKRLAKDVEKIFLHRSNPDVDHAV